MPRTFLLDFQKMPENQLAETVKNMDALYVRKMALKPTFKRLGISGFDVSRPLEWLEAKIRDAVLNHPEFRPTVDLDEDGKFAGVVIVAPAAPKPKPAAKIRAAAQPPTAIVKKHYRRAHQAKKMALKPKFEELGIPFDSHRSLRALSDQFRDYVISHPEAVAAQVPGRDAPA